MTAILDYITISQLSKLGKTISDLGELIDKLYYSSLLMVNAVVINVGWPCIFMDEWIKILNRTMVTRSRVE